MRKLIIFGAGGFAREVLWMIEAINQVRPQYLILGLVEDEIQHIGKHINGYPILGTTEFLLDLQESMDVVIAVGSPTGRKSVYERLKKNPFLQYPNIIASNVIIGPYTTLGQGNIIQYSSILTTNVQLGDFNAIMLSTTMAHDVCIGSFTSIYAGVHIAGGVQIKDEVEIGTGVNIIPKQIIEERCIIGAGAVVTSHLERGKVYVGVPAKPITDR